MTLEKLTNALKGIKKGAFVRIEYRTEVPLSAAAREMGYKAFKQTSKTIRTGVAYSHLGSVIAREKARAESGGEKKHRDPWFTWTVPNMTAKHKNKPDMYFGFASVPKTKTRSHFIVITPLGLATEMTAEQFREKGLTTPSYWNKGEPVDFQLVNIENIISLGGK